MVFMRAKTALCAALLAAPAAASSLLALDVGEGELITLQSPAATVFVAHPDVADVQIAGPRSIFVFGQAPGRTSFFALDADGRPLVERLVMVRRDLGDLRALLRARFPNASVRVTAGPGSLIVDGGVANAKDADAVTQIVEAALQEDERLVNRLTVGGALQVNLRVRIAEVARNVDERLGVNWNAVLNIGSFAFGLRTGTGVGFDAPLPPSAGSFGALGGRLLTGPADINAVIDALSREGLARSLAEPNLTTMSGETASFTAGGEFPIPVGQSDDTITIEFKPFGVILDFTPTVLDADRISLRVRPEVSEPTLDPLRSVRLNNELTVPGLNVRRVETTVEMASGQSLVIGGLLSQSSSDVVDKVPGLGDLPVLGSLFTSTRFQNDETELLVTVTPYIVRPVRPSALPTPLSGPIAGRGPRRALGALLAARAGPDAPAAALNGPVGFAY